MNQDGDDSNEDSDTMPARNRVDGGSRGGTKHFESENGGRAGSSASSLEGDGDNEPTTSKTGKPGLLSQWDLLLLDRPTPGDEHATAEWLLRVMRVSNLFTFGVDSSDRDPIKGENTPSHGIPFEQALAKEGDGGSGFV